MYLKLKNIQVRTISHLAVYWNCKRRSSRNNEQVKIIKGPTEAFKDMGKYSRKSSYIYFYSLFLLQAFETVILCSLPATTFTSEFKWNILLTTPKRCKMQHKFCFFFDANGEFYFCFGTGHLPLLPVGLWCLQMWVLMPWCDHTRSCCAAAMPLWVWRPSQVEKRNSL